MKARLLKLLYSRTINGIPGLGTPDEVANRFARETGSRSRAGDRLINYYTGLGSVTGFVFGLPGYLLMPVTVPANVVGVAVLQLHMSAAMAILGGRDLNDKATRDACVDCLLKERDSQRRKSPEEEVATRTGVKLAERGVRFLTETATRYAVRAARKPVLRRVGSRRLPLVGGMLGASSDAYVTRQVGACARAVFLSDGG